MGLTGAGPGTTVEEPKACAVPVDLHQGTPVFRLKPVGLRCPALGDQQHVPTLYGVLIENQNVMVVNPLNLQLRVPGKKRIGLGPFRSVMLGQRRIQLTQFELLRTGH